MKKITTVALTFVFCLSLAMPAMADSQKSLGVGVGMLSGSTKLQGGGSMNSTSPLLDANLLFHRKVMTWGLGFRNRSSKSALGDLKYNGVEIMLGYYSNKDKSSKLGWHILGGIGAGSLTGLKAGYKVSNIPSSYNIGLGLDVVLRKGEKGTNRRPSADVLSLDVRADGFGANVLPRNAPKTEKGKLLAIDGVAMAMTFTHHFAWK